MKDPFATAEGTTGHLIDGAAEKVQWARAMANHFLEYADELRDRADTYVHLAGLMLTEAQSYATEVSDLLVAEFPTSETFDLINKEEDEEEEEFEEDDE